MRGRAEAGEGGGRLRPPSRDRVARRALVLAVLGWRGWLELRRPEGAAAQVAACRGWLERVELLGELGDEERRLLLTEAGAWTEDDVVAGAWAAEGAGVLAWALGLLDLPPHDVKVEAPLLPRVLGVFAPEPAAFAGELRTAEELAALGAELDAAGGAAASAPSGRDLARRVALERRRALAWVEGAREAWSCAAMGG